MNVRGSQSLLEWIASWAEPLSWMVLLHRHGVVEGQ